MSSSGQEFLERRGTVLRVPWRRSANQFRWTALNPRQRHAAVLLGVAALLRFALIFSVLRTHPPTWFFARGEEIGFVARSLLSGGGFSSPFEPPTRSATGPTALIAPGYPLVVALVFGWLGAGSAAAATALMSLNAILNVITAGLILHLGRRLARESAALCAAGFWAFSPPLLWMPTIFWETSLSCLLLLAAVCLAPRLKSGTAARWGSAGVFGALAGLCNPALLPSLFALGLAAWAAGRRCLRPVAAGVLVFVLAYAAWPLRNAVRFHAFVPTRTTVGLELWIGNRPGADGFLNEVLFPSFNHDELRLYRELGEIRYMAQKTALARDWILAHPRDFVRLSVRRFARFWTGTGTRHGSMWFAVQAVLTTLLAALGVWPLRYREKQQEAGSLPSRAWLLLPILLFPLPYYVTHAEFRYRLVLEPLLCVLAAGGVERLLRWADAEQNSRRDFVGQRKLSGRRF